MFIIGQEKKIEELPLVADHELDGLLSFLNQQIQQGTPLEVPQAMPLRDLGRLLKTAVHYRDELAKTKQPETQAQDQDQGPTSRVIIPT